MNKNLGFDENKNRNIWYYEMHELDLIIEYDVKLLWQQPNQKSNSFTKERSTPKAYNEGFKNNKLFMS